MVPSLMGNPHVDSVIGENLIGMDGDLSGVIRPDERTHLGPLARVTGSSRKDQPAKEEPTPVRG